MCKYIIDVVVTSFYFKYKNLYSNMSVNAKTRGNIIRDVGLYRSYGYSTYEVLHTGNPESQLCLNRVLASNMCEVSETHTINV